jgi:hypothetical protein
MAAEMIPPPAQAVDPETHRVPAKIVARRRFLKFAVGAAVLPAVSRVARAQTYPSRPITLIIPIAAGSIS